MRATLRKHLAWILWTGTAAALQSAEHGNMGPYGKWDQAATYADQKACQSGRETVMAGYLHDNATTAKRKGDVIIDKKTLPGDESSILHSVTRYICLPDDAKPPEFVDPGKQAPPGEGAEQPPAPPNAGAPAEPAPAPPKSNGAN